MKLKIISVLFILPAICMAQKKSLFLGMLNMPKDNNSCYSASPAIPKTLDKGQIMLKSTDGGTTWEDLSSTLPLNIDLNICFVNDGEIYLGTYDGKIYHNTDVYYKKWALETLEDHEMDHAVTHIFKGKTGIYSVIYGEGIFKKTEGDKAWKNLNKQLPDKGVFASVEAPDGSILLAGDKGVFRTENDGVTWQHVYQNGWINSLTAGSDIIIANSESGLLRSTDNGLSWELVMEDKGGQYKIKTMDNYWIAISLLAPKATYLGNKSPVKISIDGGLTWQLMDTGNPADTEINDLVKMGPYIYSSRNAGISRSNDLGKTWQLLLSPYITDGKIKMNIIIEKNTIYAIAKQGGC